MGSSDMQVIFPIFMFILLVSALASFFYVTDGEVYLSEMPGSFDTGFNKTMIADNGTHWDNTTKSYIADGPDAMGMLTGIAMVIGGGALVGLTWWTGIGGFIGAGLALAGVATAFTGATRYVVSTGPAGEAFISSLPIVGAIYEGVNFIATAIVSFGGMMNFMAGGLIASPFILMLIVVPVLFMVFVFIIRFIRG